VQLKICEHSIFSISVQFFTQFPALDKLNRESQALEEDSENILYGYQAMIQQLSKAGNNAQDIQQKLEEFASSLETCETDVSNAKTKQKATDGTIFALKNQIVDIEQTLADTQESIDEAEKMAHEQADRNAELMELASKSAEYMEVIQARSEAVSFTFAKKLTRKLQKINDEKFRKN